MIDVVDDCSSGLVTPNSWFDLEWICCWTWAPKSVAAQATPARASAIPSPTPMNLVAFLMSDPPLAVDGTRRPAEKV